MKPGQALFLTFLLWTSGCADTPFVMERPASIPNSYHYVGGPDGGSWLQMEQKSRREYIITFFTHHGPNRWLFRLEGPDPVPEKLTERDLNGWDGVFMYLMDSRLRMKPIKRVP